MRKRISRKYLKNGGYTVKKVFSLVISVLILLSSFTVFSSATENLNNYEVLNYRSDFLWGQNMHTNNRGFDAPNAYSEEALHLAAQLGVKMIRYQGNYIHQDFTEADQIIGLCNKYGIKVMLCLFPQEVDEPTQDDLDFITQTTKTYAERYNGKNGRGKVDYFQLWNELEIDLQSAKYGTGATTGQSINNYYTTSVEGKMDLIEWVKNLKAASKGIREADTDAKIVINFSWVAFGCIRYYIQEGVDFDYVGWDWYAQTFDPEKAEKNFYAAMYGGTLETGNNKYDIMGLRQAIPDKDVIICESNTWVQGYAYNGGYSDENMDLESYQPFIRQMKLAYQQDWIKGFCAFKLTDSPSHSVESERHYGFISVEPGGKIIGPEPIYYEYQKRIGGTNSIEKLLKSSVDLKPYEEFKVKTQDDTDINQNVPVDQPNIKDETPEDTPIIEDIPTIENTDVVEPIIETITIKPDDIHKKTTSTITHNKIPWILIIAVGVGMLVVFAAGFATLLIIRKKRGL